MTMTHVSTTADMRSLIDRLGGPKPDHIYNDLKGPYRRIKLVYSSIKDTETRFFYEVLMVHFGQRAKVMYRPGAITLYVGT